MRIRRSSHEPVLLSTRNAFRSLRHLVCPSSAIVVGDGVDRSAAYARAEDTAVHIKLVDCGRSAVVLKSWVYLQRD